MQNDFPMGFLHGIESLIFCNTEWKYRQMSRFSEISRPIVQNCIVHYMSTLCAMTRIFIKRGISLKDPIFISKIRNLFHAVQLTHNLRSY